jgi:hypothetical protein
MKLSVGLIDFDENVEHLVDRLMQIEPLPRIFTELEYIKEPLVPGMKFYDGEKTVISVEKTLVSNSHYVPQNGRLLILTSYILLGSNTAVGMMGSATRTYFTDRNDGVIVSNYIWMPYNFSEDVEKALKNGERDLHKLATVSIKKLSNNSVIISMAHELAHSFNLEHEKYEECIMREGNHDFSQFCSNCRSKLDNFTL